MRERHRIEREESIGDEVGLTKNKEVAKRNPKLAKINKKFGMIHGLSSLANLLSFYCFNFGPTSLFHMGPFVLEVAFSFPPIIISKLPLFQVMQYFFHVVTFPSYTSIT